jgi:hypothetical protein
MASLYAELLGRKRSLDGFNQQSAGSCLHIHYSWLRIEAAHRALPLWLPTHTRQTSIFLGVSVSHH